MLLAFLVLIILLPLETRVAGIGGEVALGDWDELWLEFPHNLYFNPNHTTEWDDPTQWPMYIKVQSHSHAQWPYLWVPSFLTIEIFVQDMNATDTPQTLLDYDSYILHLSGGYPKVEWEYLVLPDSQCEEIPPTGFSDHGTFGGHTTAIRGQQDEATGVWVDEWYHLCNLFFDYYDSAGLAQLDAGVTCLFNIDNLVAVDYQYHLFNFKICVTVTYAAWWWLWSYGVKSATYDFIIGNGPDKEHAGDTTLNLLVASATITVETSG